MNEQEKYAMTIWLAAYYHLIEMIKENNAECVTLGVLSSMVEEMRSKLDNAGV
jgi:hypothetical protein